MMSCKQASERASNTLDRKLGLMEGLSLRMHVLICGHCRQFLKQITFIHRAASKLDEQIEARVELTLTDEVKKQLKTKLNNN